MLLQGLAEWTFLLRTYSHQKCIIIAKPPILSNKIHIYHRYKDCNEDLPQFLYDDVNCRNDGIFVDGSNVEFEYLLEECDEFDIVLLSLEGSDSDCEGVVVVDGVHVVIHQEHLLLHPTALLQELQVLQQLSLHLTTAVPVETSLDHPLRVNYVQHSIRVAFLAGSVDVDGEDLSHCSQELAGKWSWLHEHVLSFKLSGGGSTWVRV